MNWKIFKAAFLVTIPVLLGYLAIGIAFGLLLVNAGYPWYLALIMSVLIYAGAAQYMAVGLFTCGASFADIALVTILVNARHMVYGLSLLEKFKGTGRYKPYLIFSLTDETYALLTSVKVPDPIEPKKFYFLVSILDHSYWVIGSVIGAVLGKIITFNTKGLDFALTALFVVLLIEKIKTVPNRLPYILAGFCGIAAMIFVPQNMLIAALGSSILLLLLLRGFIKYDPAV